MGPIWGRQDPGGPHVGPMNFAIWVGMSTTLGVKNLWVAETYKHLHRPHTSSHVIVVKKSADDKFIKIDFPIQNIAYERVCGTDLSKLLSITLRKGNNIIKMETNCVFGWYFVR